MRQAVSDNTTDSSEFQAISDEPYLVPGLEGYAQDENRWSAVVEKQ